MDATSMVGKTVLFTGASRGMGRVAAIEMARRGAEILIVGHDEARGAGALAAVRAVGRGEFLLADMADAGSVRQLAERVLARTGGLHVLLHNAGGFPSAGRRTAEGVDASYALNFLGPWLLTRLVGFNQLVHQGMAEPDGLIGHVAEQQRPARPRRRGHPGQRFGLVREVQEQQPHDDDVVTRPRRQRLASVVYRELHVGDGTAVRHRRRDGDGVDVHARHPCPRVAPGQLRRELRLAAPQVHRGPVSVRTPAGQPERLAEPEIEVLLKHMELALESCSFVQVLGEQVVRLRSERGLRSRRAPGICPSGIIEVF